VSLEHAVTRRHVAYAEVLRPSVGLEESNSGSVMYKTMEWTALRLRMPAGEGDVRPDGIDFGLQDEGWRCPLHKTDHKRKESAFRCGENREKVQAASLNPF
jgi:hypothetical protein